MPISRDVKAGGRGGVIFVQEGGIPPGHFCKSVRTLPSVTQIKCSMMENEATAWDVHFCYNLSIVALSEFVKSIKTSSPIAPKSGKFDDFTKVFTGH